MDDRGALRSLFVNDAGEPIVLHLHEEPHPATRRLMDHLGVRIEVTPVTNLDLETKYCVRPLCLNEALSGGFYCRSHAPISQLRPRNGHEDSGLAALEAMDLGEPQPVPVSRPQSEEPKPEVDISVDKNEGRLAENGSKVALYQTHFATCPDAASHRRSA